jgi:hypothetical protein
VTLLDVWHELVASAALGTDRRDPPSVPDGPVADLIADLQQPAAPERLLQQAAACLAARRGGIVPAAPAALLQSSPSDERPVMPPSSAAAWARIVSDWPVLEDEWLLAVVACGRRLAPELVEPLLARHRGDGTRHARVQLAAGELGEWLIGHLPELACRVSASPDVEQVVTVPKLSISPDLAELLDATPRVAAAFVGEGLSAGRLGAAHRAVLTNFVARVEPRSLTALAAAFDAVDPSSPSIGIALALADLARLRRTMLDDLSPGTLGR